MTTITLSIPSEAKRYIKAKAAIEGLTMRDFVLREVGWGKAKGGFIASSQKTKQKKKGTIHKSIFQMRSGEAETMTAQEFKNMLHQIENE